MLLRGLWGRRPALSWNTGAACPPPPAAARLLLCVSRSPTASGTPSRYTGLLCWRRGSRPGGPPAPGCRAVREQGSSSGLDVGWPFPGHPQPSHGPQASPFLGCGHGRPAPPGPREGCSRAKPETWGRREPTLHPRGSWGAFGDPATTMCCKIWPLSFLPGRGSPTPPHLSQPESPGWCPS